MKKVFASDFDGTLYFMNTEERFHAQDVFEILFYQKRGGVFGICTGRSPDSIFDIVGNFIRPDFIISVSGALIVDREGKVLYSCPMDRGAAGRIYRDYAAQAAQVIHAGGKVYTINTPEYPLQIRVKDFDGITPDIYGMSMRLENEEAAARAAAQIREKYGEYVCAYQNVRHVDIVAAGCSKGTGITKVKELFGIDKIGGIGDSFNDLPLLEASDIGFTFPEAPEQLREAADEIVLSVSQALAAL
jgi:HAD superfamily hydrolase (TIGR01484 family)